MIKKIIFFILEFLYTIIETALIIGDLVFRVFVSIVVLYTLASAFQQADKVMPPNVWWVLVFSSWAFILYKPMRWIQRTITQLRWNLMQRKIEGESRK